MSDTLDKSASRATDPRPDGVQLESLLTCPLCGHADTLTMPTDACMFFHQCAGCTKVLRPTSGDCCVFCSYGSLPCPPMQANPAAPDCRHADGDESNA